jgi:hypothetical protein
MSRPPRPTLAEVGARTVERHWQLGHLADQLDLSPDEIARAIKLYEATEGKEGIGPRVVWGHRTVLVPESSVLAWLRRKTV